MSRNNVRGPTSALTEFLRESGITPTTVARRARTRQEEPVAGPSTEANRDEEQTSEPGPSRRTRSSRAAADYNSDDLDETDDETPASKRRKLTKTSQEKTRAAEKAKAKKGKKKDDNEDYEDSEEDDPYNALSKSFWTANGTNDSKPNPGDIVNCAKCGEKFTATKYTMAADPGSGWLCHKCAKASGLDPFKKPAQPRKRKAAAEKRTVTSFEERRMPSLAALCIQIISNHIDDVEALGDIGAVNLDEIAKSISRNRSLTPENAHLFYNVQNTKLTLYDATRLTPDAFCTLSMLNPNLTSLRLDFCGRMDDTVIAAFNKSLMSLTRVELLGPYLVRVSGWKSFFRAHASLEGFLITQSPRFDLECMTTLMQSCAGLKELRLKEVGKLGDQFIEKLVATKPPLKYLDLSYPNNGKGLTDQVCIELVESVGETLEHLDLSGNVKLTDESLSAGLAGHVHRLIALKLADIPDLTDEGVGGLFDCWRAEAPKTGNDEGSFDPLLAQAYKNPPLVTVDLSRNPELSDVSLEAISAHSGRSLNHLNVNGWKSVSENALNAIPASCSELKTIDVGFCREVTDFLIKDIFDRCEKLEEIKVWGCNRVTENCPKKRGVNVIGLESHKIL